MSSLPKRLLLTAICFALAAPTVAEAAKRRKPRPHVVAHHMLRAPSTAADYRRTATTPPLVTFGNIVIGTDPDPFIRQQLLRDLGAVFGGNE